MAETARCRKRRPRALLAGFPFGNDAPAQSGIRQPPRSRPAVIRHMRRISGAGNYTGHGRLGEDEFQQYLGPTGAADLARPIRQRPDAETPQETAAAEGHVDEDRNAAVCRKRQQPALSAPIVERIVELDE